MSGRVRAFLTPGWLLLHLVTLAGTVTMVLLGRWQLDVSESRHFHLQNFAYALQWWLFAAFALGMWVRVVRDKLRLDGSPQVAEPPAEAPTAVPYRRYVMPSSSAAPKADDPELAAYNDYLAQLAEGETKGTGR